MSLDRVLIVEDDDKLSRLYQKSLEHAGFRTRRIFNLTDAYGELMRFNPHVIVLDWYLKDEDCTPLLDYLRHVDPAMRPGILVVSGKVSVETTGLYADMLDGVAFKPVKIRDFVAKVKVIADNYRDHNPLYAISHIPLAEGIIHMKWEGTITPQHVRESMTADLKTAHTILLDMRHLNETFALEDFREFTHPASPMLRRIFVVYESDIASVAHFLMQRGPQQDIQYIDGMTWEDAKKAALENPDSASSQHDSH